MRKHLDVIFASYLTFAVCSLFAFSHGLAACEHVCFGVQRGPGSSLALTDSVESLQLFRPGHKGEHLIGTECRDRGFQFGQGCRDTHSACCVCMFCFVTVVPSHITHCNPPQSLDSPYPMHTSYSSHAQQNSNNFSAVVNNCAVYIRNFKMSAVKAKPERFPNHPKCFLTILWDW